MFLHHEHFVINHLVNSRQASASLASFIDSNIRKLNYGFGITSFISFSSAVLMGVFNLTNWQIGLGINTCLFLGITVFINFYHKLQSDNQNSSIDALIHSEIVVQTPPQTYIDTQMPPPPAYDSCLLNTNLINALALEGDKKIVKTKNLKKTNSVPNLTR